MTNHKSSIKKYSLLPYSRLVYESSRWYPGKYWYGVIVRIIGGAKDEKRWRDAIRTALANHPVFSTHIDCRGLQYAVELKDMLNGPYHHVSLRVDQDDLLFSGRLSRILGDGNSLIILMDDIRGAYYGECLGLDDYFGYLDYTEQYQLTSHYQESRRWLECEFANEAIPVHPVLDKRLWTFFPPKPGVYSEDHTDFRMQIVRFAKANSLTMEGFLSLCVALAIAEYCGTQEAALTWSYIGRERMEEKRIFGSLHRDVPFKICRKSKGKNQKNDLIRQACNQIREGIAHSDYPYTLTAPYNKRWNYAVNVLRVEDENELIKLLPQPVELLQPLPQKYAYALLDVEIHETFEHLFIVYRYSATHYKEESIHRFAALVRKYAEWLLEN